MTEWKVSEIYEPIAEDSTTRTSIPLSDKDAEKKAKVGSIAQWAEDDRPRERLIAHGAETLSTAELLAILIGSGTPTESAVDLMKRVLADHENSLARLSRMSLSELQNYTGIGQAKAVTILAACELGRRRESEEKPTEQILDSPEAIYEHMRLKLRDLSVEEAHVVLMTQKCRLIHTYRLSHGGLTETAVDIRVMMKEALLHGATVMALVHNHPSGNTHPSKQDDDITKKVAEACRTMRITFLDHVIITDGAFYSYHNEGKL